MTVFVYDFTGKTEEEVRTFLMYMYILLMNCPGYIILYLLD